jgi:alkylated DNA repair dioxygenase AlkB
MSPASAPLFGVDVPDGFEHRDDFITLVEELSLAGDIGRLEFAEFEMRGVVARRRVAFFGASYDQGSAPTAPMPGFLLPMRERLAAWAGIRPDAFAMALVNEYRPGAPIGWHRDAPQYDVVAGISLLSPARMRFRRYMAPSAAAGTRRVATHELTLLPRSAYLMRGPSRSDYEHSIPAVPELRYSITFRTLRNHGR